MSDASFRVVNRKHHKGVFDAVDEKWLIDCLSDDEIDVPKLAVFLIDDDEDEDNEGEYSLPSLQEEKWNDLGLERLQIDAQSQSHTLLQMQSANPTTTTTQTASQTATVATTEAT